MTASYSFQYIQNFRGGPKLPSSHCAGGGVPGAGNLRLRTARQAKRIPAIRRRVIEGVVNTTVFGMGQSIRITGTVKEGAIAFGGDVIIEGAVDGDVAAIGGSVIQREGARIGGDVIVLGGIYHHGKAAPDRDRRA
jgi:hypothetical protein